MASFSQKTTKIVWGQGAGICSMPDCRKELFLDETETDDESLIGEMCHIVGESEDGPRGVSPLTKEDRDRSSNLILLCRNHHREIDSQPGAWSVERLHEIKTSHQQWVRRSLPGYDQRKQRDEETYADYVDTWARLSWLDRWTGWSSFVLGSGQPRMSAELDGDLEELRGWLLRRVWPGRYRALERSLQNFMIVLSAFQESFREHATSGHGVDTLWTEKFYKIDRWDPEAYARLAKQYDFHVGVVSDLMLELTRAANLVCDQIRVHLNPSYRMNEGRLAIMSGPDMNLSFHERVVLYSSEEVLTDPPFQGLQKFLEVRTSRDFHFGKGTAPK